MDKQEQEAQEQAIALRSQVDALQVTDQKSYALAQEINKKAYAGKKAFHVWFDPIDDTSQEGSAGSHSAGKEDRRAL